MLWLVVAYRRVNLVETFQDWRAEGKDLELQGDAGPPNVQEWSSFAAFAKARFEKGEKPIFTNAHICSGGIASYTEGCERLRDDLALLAQRLTEAATGGKVTRGSGPPRVVDLEACFILLKKELDGVGEFFAWQILCDVIEAIVCPTPLTRATHGMPGPSPLMPQPNQ